MADPMNNKELRKFGLVTGAMLILFFAGLIPWIWESQHTNVAPLRCGCTGGDGFGMARLPRSCLHGLDEIRRGTGLGKYPDHSECHFFPDVFPDRGGHAAVQRPDATQIGRLCLELPRGVPSTEA